MTSGTLIREARLRAGLSQAELSERSGKDRAPIARWETDVVQPSLETLRDLIQRPAALISSSTLVPYAASTSRRPRSCGRASLRTPQERLNAMLKARRR